MYRINITTQTAAKTPMTWGVPNDYLNPNTSSMKMIAWKCQEAGSVTFCNHAYELHCRHRPEILIILEPRIAEERLKQLLILFLTITLSLWILLVSPEAYGSYGMKVLPSTWKFSPTVSIVSMLL